MEFRFSETRQWTAEPGSSLKGVATHYNWRLDPVIWMAGEPADLLATSLSPSGERSEHTEDLPWLFSVEVYAAYDGVSHCLNCLHFFNSMANASLDNYFFSPPSPAILNPSIILQAELTPKPLLDHLPLKDHFRTKALASALSEASPASAQSPPPTLSHIWSHFIPHKIFQ